MGVHLYWCLTFWDIAMDTTKCKVVYCLITDTSLSAHADSIIPLPCIQGIYFPTCSNSYIKGSMAVEIQNSKDFHTNT